MEQSVDMQVDLTGDELVALYCTALVGVGTMSGSMDLTNTAIDMLTDMEVDPLVAASGIRKIRSAMMLTSRLVGEVS